MPVVNTFKGLIDERGWTPYKLAKETGINYSTACRLVRDEKQIPRQDVLDKVCENLHVQPPLKWIP